MAKGQQKVTVTFLGGVGEIGKNMTAIECGGDMIIVDCGVAFAKEDSPGIDAIIPDISYIKQNIGKLRGIVLTHGHEDHIGAIPYYTDELKSTPIYGTALTIGLLKRKLERNAKKCNLNVIAAGDTVKLGGISVEFIRVVHSMAGACSLNITTPAGTVFVTGDFKFDNAPIDGKKTNTRRIAQVGDKGVLLMLGESTNIERKGSSNPERVVGKSLEKIFMDNASKRLVIACFASSNHRVQQILTLASKYNRKVVLAGKSMKAIVEVASECGELNVPKGVIVDSVGRLLPHETLILATGSQGEPLSALKKMSKGEFNKINLGTNDVVVLSSTPIPGNEKSVYDVINDLFRKGADVIYDSMNDIHVSGHAYEEELKRMLTLVRPQFFMPVHGEYRHQFKHMQLAKSLGVLSKNIVIPNIGESYGVTAKGIKKHSNVPSGNIYVDGVVLEDGQSVVNDRRSLAEYGMLIVLAAVDVERGVIVGDVDIVARGFNLTVEVEKSIRAAVIEGVNGVDLDKADVNEYARSVKKSVRKLFYRDRQFPIIIPVIVKD
ncbi:MAG: ribonuclease J [Clostridia bacterium]|nr:ribonuclease J [Clostridia bacterium]